MFHDVPPLLTKILSCRPDKSSKYLCKYINNPTMREAIVDKNNPLTATKLVSGLIHLTELLSPNETIVRVPEIPWNDFAKAFSKHFNREPVNKSVIVIYFMNDSDADWNIISKDATYTVTPGITRSMMIVVNDDETFSIKLVI